MVRRFRSADLEGMTALCNARTQRDGYGEFLTLAAMIDQYAHLQRCDPETDLLVADRAGDVVGYARTTWDDTIEGVRDHWLIVEADPSCAGADEHLMTWCEQRATEVAGTMRGEGRLVAEAFEGSERQRRLVARGFTALRYGAMMVRPHLRDIPDDRLPEGVERRPVIQEHLRAIWEADAAAFRDHRGYVEPTEADWGQFRDGAAHEDIGLWQVAWFGDEVVGQVRTHANAGDRELFGVHRAWTENISTVREWRKQGVASALICASLRQLAERGYEQAVLGVDTENPNGAFALYESLGYAVVAMDALYARPL